MRDDLAALNIGTAEKEYQRDFFWRSYRDIEQWMTRILSKGPIRVSTFTADGGTILGDLLIDGDIAITGIISEPFWVTRNDLVLAIVGGLTIQTGRLYTAGGFLYVGSAGATAIPDLLGLLPFGDIFAQHFGAVGSGAVDETIAINRAFAYVDSRGGGLLRFTWADFLLQNPVTLAITNDIEVVCEAGAKFIAAAGFPADRMFYFTGGTDRRVKWSGGLFDGRTVTRGANANLVEFDLAGAASIVLEDMELECGDEFVTGGGNNCLQAGWAKRISLNRIKVKGAPVAGIFVFGGATGDGSTEFTEDFTYDNITCHGCTTGLTAARRFKRLQGGKLSSLDCINGLILGTEFLTGGGTTILQAEDITVQSVVSLHTENTVILRWADAAKVESVVIREMGTRITAGAGYTSPSMFGMRMQGCRYCIVGSMTALNENSLTPGTSRVVYVEPRTVNAVVRNSTDNQILAITSSNIDRIAEESSTSQNRNIFPFPMGPITTGTGPIVLGAASVATGAFNLIDVLTANGLGTGLEVCLDAGDALSVTVSTATTWLDRSGKGQDFWRGADVTATATDPTYAGVVGARSLTEYYSFDGGDYFTYDSANEAWMTAMHEDNAAFSCLGWFYPNTAVAASLFGTVGASATANGVALVVSSTGQLQFVARNGVGDSLNVASGVNNDVAAAGWNFFGMSINEATGANGLALYIRNKIVLATSTYATPGVGAANAVLQIGARGAGNTPLTASSRMGCIAFWSRALSANEVAVFKDITRRRYRL